MNIDVTLKFLATGYNSFYQAFVKVFDTSNNLVFEGYTYNGIIKLCLEKNNAYKVNASLFNSRLFSSFYVGRNNTFIFNLNPAIINRTITFLLTDSNYNNLPIMRGEMILGKNN